MHVKFSEEEGRCPPFLLSCPFPEQGTRATAPERECRPQGLEFVAQSHVGMHARFEDGVVVLIAFVEDAISNAAISVEILTDNVGISSAEAIDNLRF